MAQREKKAELKWFEWIWKSSCHRWNSEIVPNQSSLPHRGRQKCWRAAKYCSSQLSHMNVPGSIESFIPAVRAVWLLTSKHLSQKNQHSRNFSNNDGELTIVPWQYPKLPSRIDWISAKTWVAACLVSRHWTGCVLAVGQRTPVVGWMYGQRFETRPQLTSTRFIARAGVRESLGSRSRSILTVNVLVADAGSWPRAGGKSSCWERGAWLTGRTWWEGGVCCE